MVNPFADKDDSKFKKIPNHDYKLKDTTDKTKSMKKTDKKNKADPEIKRQSSTSESKSNSTKNPSAKAPRSTSSTSNADNFLSVPKK